MRKQKKVFITMLGFLFLVGLDIGSFQQIILSISEEYGLTYTQMSSMVSVKCVLNFICVLIFGPISDKIGKKKVLQVASTVYVVGNIIVALSHGLILTYIGVSVIGMAFGICEGLSSAILADTFPDNSERMLTLSQGFCSMGAVLGPIISNFAITNIWNDWRIVFVVLSAVMIILLSVLCGTNVQRYEAPSEECGDEKNNKQHFDKAVLVVVGLLFISMFLYSGTENGMGYFVDTFFERGYNAAKYSTIALSGLWFAMLISRFACSIFKSGQKNVVMLMMTATLVLTLLIYFEKSAQRAALLCILLGASFGPVWPMLISFAVQQKPERSGTITSWMSAASAIGASVFPVLMGKIADSAQNVAHASILLVIITGLNITIFMAYRLSEKRLTAKKT